MEETDPDIVGFELDAGWCATAGIDPIEILRKYKGRIKLIHIKECDRVVGTQLPIDLVGLNKDENGRPIFSDDDLELFARMKQINCAAGQGCQSYIVEREYTYEGTRLDCLKADYDYYHQIYHYKLLKKENGYK